MGESILKSQHAFMKGKSTTTQLTQISHLISESVDIHGLVEALYLNFSKAFDRVIEMVHKQSVTISGSTSEWLSDTLGPDALFNSC